MHKGIHELTIEELDAAMSGQGGYVDLYGGNLECGVTAGLENVEFFCAIKVCDGVNAMQLRTLEGARGDDYCKNGVYNEAHVNSIMGTDGDIIYGVFDKVFHRSGSAGRLMCYIGRTK
tara:strand:+ start:426 stop:779 length:354 start_codon:yes stop_codon:yes gene_type:complete